MNILITNNLKTNLTQCTKKELISIARFHHVPGYSSLKKEDLVNRLHDYLSTPAVLERFFMYLGTDELDAFFHSNSFSSTPQDSNSVLSASSHLFQRLRDGGYCFFKKNNTIQIPKDIQQFPIFTKSFIKVQQKKSFLLDCLNTAGYLYGCAPIAILLKMYNRHASTLLKKEELLHELEEIPEYFHSYILEKDIWIPISLYQNNLYKKIQQCQKTLPYYLPEKEEIKHLSRYGYFPEDNHTRKLALCIKELFFVSLPESKEISGHIQSIFRQGGSIREALLYLENQFEPASDVSPDKPSFPPLSDKRLLSSLNEVFAHTRLLLNRGYTDIQIQNLKKKKIKIYPNTPCPCGSGKKYKNCCGKL